MNGSMKNNDTTWVLIENQGEIEEGGLVLMGASTKENTSDKIGFFGSGNKYAVACLLREGIPFEIYSGETKIPISTRAVQVRGETFHQILINRKRTSLTTRLGPEWEPWFALREFIANARDEGTEVVRVVDEIEPLAGTTRIYVKCVGEIESFMANYESYFAFNSPVLQEIEGSIRRLPNRGDRANIFRKGISIVPEDFHYKALWWYDFETIEINESRVYKYEFQIREKVSQALGALDCEDDVKAYLNLTYIDDNEYIENEADWNIYHILSPAWHEALKGHDVCASSIARFFGAQEDRRGAIIVPDQLAKVIARNFSDIHVLGHTDKPFIETLFNVPFAARLKTVHDALVKDALISDMWDNLRAADVDDEKTIAWYDSEKNLIYIVQKYFEENVLDRDLDSELAYMLVEEFIHTQGYDDGTRAFAEYCIRRMVDDARKLRTLQKIERLLNNKGGAE